jgi:tRNA_anti-like
MLEGNIITNTIVQLNKKIIIAGFLIAAFAVGIYAYKEYNRKPANLQNLKADVNVSAKQLVNDFTTNEETANTKYLGKVLNVNGFLFEVQNLNDTLLTLLIGDSSQVSKVSCLIDRVHIKNSKKYKQGDSVSIKGICTGYLMDVELNRCVVEK